MLTSIDSKFLLSLRCFCENSEYKGMPSLEDIRWCFLSLCFFSYCQWEQLVLRRGTFRRKRKKEQTLQAQIHTGFHRFTEIRFFILSCLYSFTNEIIWWNNVPNCKASSKETGTGQYPVWMTQKPRKRDFGELKSQEFLKGACPWTALETCAFRARLGNWSIFILDPRLLCIDTVYNWQI